MNETRILGLMLQNGSAKSVQLQDIFTKFGNVIRTRLGLNHPIDDNIPANGIIILELTGEVAEMDKLETALKNFGDIQIQSMSFKF